jgi:hypothetical protein
MPSNKKEVQSFVSFVNLYRHFIPGFSHHARALFDLTMKDVRFIWGFPQEDSFKKLKEPVTSALVLVLPNDNLPFRLEADGSSIATGTVLSQEQVDNNAWHPVVFLSKALNPVDDGGGCCSVTQTCPNASEARLVLLRYERGRGPEVDDFQ